MRIVALSDQHGFLPPVPPCDLLIVAGDICPDRIGPHYAMREPDQQKAWFDREARPWLAKAQAARRILTWGNHDWCGEACDFDRDAPDRAGETIEIIVDDAVRVAGRNGGPPITVWATPWSNTFMTWAFMKPPAALGAIYDAIPSGVDILVSHQPPYGYGDRCRFSASAEGEHVGSRELLGAIERVRPQLVICGHIHEGYGRYEHNGVPIYNVSVVNERYELAHEPTVLTFENLTATRTAGPSLTL
jgi:Calcineurin-like phosphoesterase